MMKELDQFTVEQLEKYSKLEALTFPPSHAQVAALARIALAVKTSNLNSPETPDGWVSCNERMPENNEQVLTWNGQYKTTDLFLAGSFLCNKPNLITHWMPLPAAPTELLEG